MKAFVLIFLIVLIPSSHARAGTVQEDPLESQVREVAKTLRCAVCQSESLWESHAELDQQMRQVIRQRLAGGESPEEVRAYFLSRYGDYILLKPTKRGLNLILWAGPFILLAAGGFFLYRTLTGWVAVSSSSGPSVLPPLKEEERKRIERELTSPGD
jgi:cytochrome c-type biogenesis protein CcmH